MLFTSDCRTVRTTPIARHFVCYYCGVPLFFENTTYTMYKTSFIFSISCSVCQVLKRNSVRDI